MRARAPMLFAGSCAIVLTQVATAAAVSTGAGIKSCGDNFACDTGWFCGTGFQDRCQTCGGQPPFVFVQDGKSVKAETVPGYPDVFNRTEVMELCSNPRERSMLGSFGANVVVPTVYVRNWCDACVHGPTGDVSVVSAGGIMAASINNMGLLDWAAYIFVGVIIGLAVVG